MATLQQVVQLVFEGVDNASAASKSVLNGLGDIADAGKSLTQPLADATSSILKFQAGALLAGAALAGVAANEAQKFEIAFREIATLIEQPVENLDKFRRSILEYGQSSTQTLDSIIKATYDAISAGVDYKDALDAVRQSEILAVAGKTELGDANRILLQIVSAYADSNLTAAEAADKLFTIVRTGVTTLPDLSQSIGGVVSIAAQAGISFDELGAAVATLTKTQDTAAAITALKGVITGIIAPSAEAKKAAEELGLDFSASGIKANTFAGTLQQVIDKTDGNIDKISVLFGNVRGLSGVLGLATSEGAAFAANLDAQKNSAGAAQEAFAKFTGILDTGVDALKILAIQLGEPIAQAFVNAKSEITNLTNALANALLPGGPLSGLSEALGKFGADVEATIKDVAKNLPAALENVDFSGFLKSLESLWSAIGRLLRVEDLRTEEGLTKVIQTIVDLLTQTTVYTEGALKALGPFVEKMGEFVVSLSQIDPNTILLIGELGGYALAANVAFTALAGAVLIVKGALPALALATSAVATAKAGLVAGLSGAGGLVALLGPVGLGASALAAAASYAVLEISSRKQEAINKELKDGLGPLVDEIEREAAAAKVVRERIDGMLDARAEEARKTDGVAESLKRLTDYWKEQGFAYDAVTGALVKLNEEQGKFAQQSLLTGFDNVALDAYVNSLGQVVTQYDQIGGGTVKATGAFAEVKDKTNDAAKALDELIASGQLTTKEFIEVTKNANDFKVKMEEIASDERIKTIEASVTLNVARLEADVERVKATFASIDNTINSTGDLLGNLFGLLGDASSFDKLNIQSQIDLENKRRQEALDIQKELAKAEIARIEAQTRQLDRGDPWIRIDGTGLQPQLEAFMWEILKATRTQVSAEFGNFLLGVAPA
jgi:TP901 family phage tail tape measure protein